MALVTRSLVANGIAVNLIVYDTDSGFEPPEGFTLEDPEQFPYDPAPIDVGIPVAS